MRLASGIMGIEDYQQSAKYRRRLAMDYRLVFPHLTEPDEQALAEMTREQLESAYEARLRQIEKYYGKDRNSAEAMRARLDAGLQHLVAFIDERDSVRRRMKPGIPGAEELADRPEFKSIFLSGPRKTKLIAIGGGKGGVGKSLISASMGIALATMGKQVVAVDMDLGGADLHFALGLRNVSRSLNDFLDRKFESLEEVRLNTAYRNLSLIATDSSRLGSANIKYALKEKVLRHLGKLDCDVVLIDLGAEVSFNVLDFFLAADSRYVVTSPEPTSVLEAYGLVKLSLYRKIKHFAGELIPPASELGELVQDFLFEKENDNNGKPRNVWQLIDHFGQTDPELHDKLLRILWQYNIELVINMSEKPRDFVIAQTFTKLCQDNLALNVEHSYLIPWDHQVRDAARKLIPIVIESPTCPSARALLKLASDAAFTSPANGEMTRKISQVAGPAKERVRKMGEMQAIGRPGQPVNKIAPIEDEKPPSKIKTFLAKEIRFRRDAP